jgi:IS5 family transposase
MRPKQRDEKGSGDLFRARLDQIIDMKHELVRLSFATGIDRDKNLRPPEVRL